MGIISAQVNYYTSSDHKKQNWDNTEGGKMTDCSSQKKGSYLSLNAVI